MLKIINKILIVLLIIVLILIVGIIFKDINIEELFATNSRFITSMGYDTPGSTYIIIDNETKVMYLWHEDNYKGGLTIMLDKDGKPLLFENK